MESLREDHQQSGAWLVSHVLQKTKRDIASPLNTFRIGMIPSFLTLSIIILFHLISKKK